jgi:hypothetical protein
MKKRNIIGKGKKPPARATASVKNSWTSPKRIEMMEKRNEALNYRRQGYSFQAIADAMNTAIVNVHRWVVEGLREIPRENAEELVTMELERIDECQASIYANAIEGDLAAQAAYLNLARERSKLLGLYPDDRGAMKVKATQTNGAGAGAEGDDNKLEIEVSFVRPRNSGNGHDKEPSDD